MINVPVFIALLAIAIGANIVVTPKIIGGSTYLGDFRDLKILRLSALSQSLFVSSCACLVGAYAAPREGLATHFLTALLRMEQPIAVFLKQLAPALIVSVPILLSAMLLNKVFARHYRAVFQNALTSLRVQALREGVIDEIVFRWGLMSLLAFILDDEFLDRQNAMYIAIMLAAFASSLVRISDMISLNLGYAMEKLVVVFLVNFLAALCYGWLFFRYGLTAAVICHTFVVVVSVYGGRLYSFFIGEEAGWGI